MNFSIQQLQSFIKEMLIAYNAKPDRAQLFAEILVESDMWGVSSHGVTKMIQYAWMIENNHLQLNNKLEEISSAGAFKSFDAHQGMGHVDAFEATLESMVIAKKKGVSMVTARNLTHIGMLGFYSYVAAKKDLICLIMSSGPTKALPAFGGKTPIFGTSPFSYAVPMKDKDPIILDMSLAAMPLNKLRAHAANGEKISLNIGSDKNGIPTENPKEVLDGGYIHWAGEHKGYGLGVLFEVMSGVLSSGIVGGEKPESKANSQNASNSSINVICIDPQKIMDMNIFSDKVNGLYKDVEGSSRRDKDQAVYLPGEIEMHRRKISLVRGVDIDIKVVDSLNKIAKKLGINTLGRARNTTIAS